MWDPCVSESGHGTWLAASERRGGSGAAAGLHAETGRGSAAVACGRERRGRAGQVRMSYTCTGWGEEAGQKRAGPSRPRERGGRV